MICKTPGALNCRDFRYNPQGARETEKVVEVTSAAALRPDLSNVSQAVACISGCFGETDVDVGDGACILRWLEDVLAWSVWHVCFSCLPKTGIPLHSSSREGQFLLHKSLFDLDLQRSAVQYHSFCLYMVVG